MDTVKQVIVIRHDLHMRQGKVIAQGAHAAMMFLVDAEFSGRDLTEMEEKWFSLGMMKICVRVNSEEELNSVIARCREVGVKCFAVTDAGHTEFHGIPTLTCCAVGPDYADRIDPITGDLKLL